MEKDPGICLGMFNPNAYGFEPKKRMRPKSDPNCVQKFKKKSGQVMSLVAGDVRSGMWLGCGQIQRSTIVGCP